MIAIWISGLKKNYRVSQKLLSVKKIKASSIRSYKNTSIGLSVVQALTHCYGWSTEFGEIQEKYAEFFSDFCMYQDSFLGKDPYLMACAIVAYTRKYMGVAIIWSQDME